MVYGIDDKMHTPVAKQELRPTSMRGRSFTRYEGTWRVIPRDGGATVTYELTARPAFDVPQFILKRLLKRDSGQMIDRLRQEIAARAAR